MTTGGGPKQPPVRNPTLPGVGAKVATAPQAQPKPLVQTPKAPASSPSAIGDAGMSREEIRGVAHAIARAEATVFRDELVARIVKIEERMAALEKKPVTPPPIPQAPITAPLPTPVAAPVAVAAPVPATAPAVFPPITAPVFTPAPAPATPPPLPVAAPTPAASIPVALDSVPVVAAPPAQHTFDTSFDENMAHPFGSSRRRVGIFLVVIMVLAVSGIVIAAMVSQAMNNHSGH